MTLNAVCPPGRRARRVACSVASLGPRQHRASVCTTASKAAGRRGRASPPATRPQPRPALPGTDIEQPPTGTELEYAGELVDLGQCRVAVRTEVASERPPLHLTGNRVLPRGPRALSPRGVLACDRRPDPSTLGAPAHRPVSPVAARSRRGRSRTPSDRPPHRSASAPPR